MSENLAGYVTHSIGPDAIEFDLDGVVLGMGQESAVVVRVLEGTDKAITLQLKLDDVIKLRHILSRCQKELEYWSD
jgi:hypothetical protein